MHTKPTPPKPDDLSTHVLSGWFGGVWVIFLAVIVTKFWWVRNIALVCWVYGREAYFHGGIRVLPGKPTRFSTGEPVPQLPDIVTGFSYFIVVALGLSLLLIFGLRAYERYQKKRKTT